MSSCIDPTGRNCCCLQTMDRVSLVTTALCMIRMAYATTKVDDLVVVNL